MSINKVRLLWLFLCLWSVFFTTVVGLEATDLIAVETDNEDEASTMTMEEEPTSTEPFIPTDQWQTIKQGQSIPPGLHVRMNLQTGVKEAKLMDKEEPTHPVHSTQSLNQDSNRRFSPEELKEALKAMKSDEFFGMDKMDESINIPKSKSKFRNIDELKRDLKKLNLNVKGESEVVLDILTNYAKNNEASKMKELQDLEFLVHKFDTAQDFVKLGGLDLIVPDLNSTNPNIRSLVAFTLGSAMQGNPRVQIASLEHNVLSYLLRLVTLDPEFSVRNRGLYAISCLVRQFPFAQLRLIENGGIASLVSILREHTNPDTHKLQLKVLTLFHDLLSEKELAKQHFSVSDKEQLEKLRQYQSFNLEEALVSNGACELVTKLLPSPDIDTQEKVIAAMLSMIGHCRDQFKKDMPKLHQLAQLFRLRAAKESDAKEDPTYYTSLYSSVDGLVKEMRHQKEEL